MSDTHTTTVTRDRTPNGNDTYRWQCDCGQRGKPKTRPGRANHGGTAHTTSKTSHGTTP